MGGYIGTDRLANRTRRQFIFRDIPAAALTLSSLGNKVYATVGDGEDGLRKGAIKYGIESNKENLSKINIINADDKVFIAYSDDLDRRYIRDVLGKYRNIKQYPENIAVHSYEVDNPFYLALYTVIGALSGLVNCPDNKTKVIGSLLGAASLGSLSYALPHIFNSVNLPVEQLAEKISKDEKIAIIYDKEAKKEIEKLDQFTSNLKKYSKVEQSTLYDILMKEIGEQNG